MKTFASINWWSRKTAALITCGLGIFTGAASQAQPFSIATLAGYAGKGSADGMGGGVLFSGPQGVAVDGAGNVYVADSGNNTIRVITAAGISSTLAGMPGVTGNADGTGTNALFNQPSGIALDGATNIYVSDYGNSTIRKVTRSGQVITIAGTAGITGSLNATGTNALFFNPMGIAADSATNLYVADYGNHLIRKITPGLTVSTLAGLAGVFGFANGTGTAAQFYEPEALAVDQTGNVYVADTGNAAIRLITAGGGVTTFAGTPGVPGSTDAAIGTNALFYQPSGIAIDNAGNLYVADYFNNDIRQISPAGIVTTLAGLAGTAGSADGANNSARFWGPQGVAVNSAGTIYVADTANSSIRMVTPSGVVTTLVGSPSAGSANGTGFAARFYNPHNIAVDGSTNLYLADTQNNVIRKITPSGVVTVLAGTPGVSGSVDGPGSAALFSAPRGVAVDSAGNVYVADTGNNTIRIISPAGMVSTLAGMAGNPGNADGVGTGAQFYEPEGVAVDKAFNVYVTDSWNHTIRKITSGGVTTTLAGLAGTFGSFDGANSAARFNCPAGISIDSTGNLYVADYNNDTIRKVTPAGAVTTLAGSAGTWGSVDGTNSGALFFSPAGVSVNNLGELYVVDSGNNTLRKMTPSGNDWVVSTVAGMPGASGSMDGFGTAAGFYYPAGIVVDKAGYVYVADSGNNTVRLVNVPITIENLAVAPEFISAFISWSTPVEASSQVLYGPTTSYGSISALDTAPRTSHTVVLSDLAGNTVYYFEVISMVGTNEVTAAGTFTTEGPIILQALQATYNGVWTIATSPPDKYSSSYKYASTTTGSDSATALFQPTIITPGYYDVYIWYSEGSNRSTNVPVLTSFQGGSVSTRVNQTVPGGNWQLLTAGQYFAAGANSFVRIGNGTGETGKVVVADAIEWVYSANQNPTTNNMVPAWWANYYFGTNTVDSTAPGSNGYSLFANYILGTSPIDPNSTLNFGISQLKHGIQATFSPWQNGNIYGLQSSSSLAHPVWTNIPNLTVTQNTNGDGVITITNVSGSKAFYRLSVQTAP